mmetsp:Transcript_87738/g.107523  ORF Transcript_87738/g.107523 Transcript_87738/m.107523 type:complete len:86 (+) Transcript_87738:29-286(+)
MSGNLGSLRTEYTFGRSIPSVITKNHSRVISCDEIEFDYQNLSIKTNKTTKIKRNNNNSNNNSIDNDTFDAVSAIATAGGEPEND